MLGPPGASATRSGAMEKPAGEHLGQHHEARPAPRGPSESQGRDAGVVGVGVLPGDVELEAGDPHAAASFRRRKRRSPSSSIASRLAEGEAHEMAPASGLGIEGAHRDGGHPAALGQHPAERHVVVVAEGPDVGHGEVRSRGGATAKPASRRPAQRRSRRAR